MKEYILELIASKEGFNAKLNLMREYLQAYTLRILFEIKFLQKSVFLGGTALRFLYDLPRFSEDLDFSILEKSDYTFIDIIKKIKKELILAGYDISITYNDKKTVQYAMIKFKTLMYEAKISPHKEKIFSIKLEIDTNPPQGANTNTHIINRYFLLSFFGYDLSSLFAGKLHAILSRKYTKGRDFFDLGWYLTKWKDITPNIPFLKNALAQTGSLLTKKDLSEDNWRDYLYAAVEKADWSAVKNDVENFLASPADLEILSKPNILKLLSRNL